MTRKQFTHLQELSPLYHLSYQTDLTVLKEVLSVLTV